MLSYNFNVQHEACGTLFQASLCGQQGHHLRSTAITTRASTACGPSRSSAASTIQQSVSNSNYNGMWMSAQQASREGPDLQHLLHVVQVHRQQFRGQLQSADAELSATSRPSGRSPISTRATASCSAALTCCRSRPRAPLAPLVRRLDPVAHRQPAVGQSVQPDHFGHRHQGEPGGVRPSVHGARRAADTCRIRRPVGYLNPAAFIRQATGFGNAGRNILTAPGFEDIDFSIAKNTAIKERALAAVPRGGIQPVQPSELRPAGE